MITNNFFNTILNQTSMEIDLNFIDFLPYGLMLVSAVLGIISISSLILYSANAAKEGLKTAGKIITGVGVGSSVYTGVKEVYKDLKDLVSTDNSEQTSKGSTSTDKNNSSTSKK